MASVTSLGLHRPASLQHAIDEGILPPDPSPSLYTWETIITVEDGHQYEDELLTTSTCVLWSRGGLFRKSFSFDVEKEPITQALLAWFPGSEDSITTTASSAQTIGSPIRKPPSSTPKRSPPPLCRALVVFLKTQAHIYFLSGTSHVVHMPFEVESACAAPRGVIIQRKLRPDGASVSMRLPKVTPSSFVSPLPPAGYTRDSGHSFAEFSTEGLGNPKTLPLRLSFTLENMWQHVVEAPDSHWPRLVCLTDPLLELGLVVTHPERPKTSHRRGRSPSPNFLSPSEEILHVESLRVPQFSELGSNSNLILAVTANREANTYTVWRLSYLEMQDPFVKQQKKSKPKPSRRRSSMAPGLASGASTPLHQSTRESFGAAPLPGKKSKKGAKVKEEDRDKALDKALSSLDPDKNNEATSKQSRRVSSLLARADLSASQDRGSFVEPTLHASHHGGRRGDSHGSQRGRLSSGYGGPSFSASLNRSINHPPDPPIDDLLEELKAGGDFEAFHNMGLEDHGFDGLEQEMLFTKIQSVNMESTNLRYSLSSKPARLQAKVFFLLSPSTAPDDQGRPVLLIAIQDPVDKRLQLLTLYLEQREEHTSGRNSSKQTPTRSIHIVPGEPRRVQSVVDSCKISDGYETIMILSEDNRGGRELSLQSPWGKVTTVHLPDLRLDDANPLGFPVSYASQLATPKTTELSSKAIDALCHTNTAGEVDLRDHDGRHHRIRIQLQPTHPQVRKVLDVCRSVLPSSYADKIVAGWAHIMQWLHTLPPQPNEYPLVNREWSAAVILILSSILALSHHSESSLRTLGGETSSTTMTEWDVMLARQAPGAMGCPRWMRSRAWQWILDLEPPPQPSGPSAGGWFSEGFIPTHVGLAKRWMASDGGLKAFGFEGFLPTALNQIGNPRETMACSMLLALHLFMEEQKLNIMVPEDLSPGPNDVRALLCVLFKWVGWKKYEEMYALSTLADVNAAQDLIHPAISGLPEPASEYCVLTWVQGHLTAGRGPEFPTLAQLYATATRDTVGGRLRGKLWSSLTPRTLMFQRFFARLGSTSSRFDVVVAMHDCGFTPQILETLPEAILTPLQDVISICQPSPPPSWPEDLLKLVGRPDMCAVLRPRKSTKAPLSDPAGPSHVAKWDYRMLCQNLLGLHEHVEETEDVERQTVVRSLFREDRRLNEARNLLSTIKNRVVRLDPRPEWTEAEYLERQKELVTTTATSTLAIPAGRGLLYFALRFPLLTQKYHIPGFNLTCVVKPANNTVGVDKSMFPEEKINWAFFHQGVAGGLAISPHAKGIDTSWILFNKPGQDLSNRHAGFLLALGLNGHLKGVAKWVAFKYLTPKHTMTTIGLLLGLAASYIGTMDSLITRLLSVHVTRMMPAGSAELNISRHTQTTGIMGIGLLYCNSQHRRMSENILKEIEATDVDEEDDDIRDESYRLAAGFALGLINLGKGGDLRGLRDMQLTEKLLTLATAVKGVEKVHVLDRSAAGAVVAIALIYLKSEDHIVARKIDIPDTMLQFDYVRPDILLLRTVARNLIVWNDVDPTFDWIRKRLPQAYQSRYQLTTVTKLSSCDLPFFSIVAGLCFSLGLRFAGSANLRVRDLLVHYLDQFMRIVRLPVDNFDAELARSNANMCMDVVALSCAAVMAGTGDIVVLRRLRALHGRDDANTTYGSHMAAHLAIGALFLGCGTATFGTGDLAVAALLIAFYPLFPTSVQDNRSHLQAFRHFWVLATEPRCLVVKDFATGEPLNVPIVIHLKGGSQSAIAASAQEDSSHGFANPKPKTSEAAAGAASVAIRKQTPCLLPPLDDILRVETDARSLGYWDLTIDFASSPKLISDFRDNQTVYLRRRPASEGTFAATLRALGDNTALPSVGDPTPEGGVAYGQGGKDPLEWLFTLPSLQSLSRAERAVVLDRFGFASAAGFGAPDVAGTSEAATTAVDARLVLRSGLEDGWSRDRLVGLRMLFEWAERRGVFAAEREVEAARRAATSSSSEQAAEQTEQDAGEKGKGKGKGRGKKGTAAGKGKKKVSIGVGEEQGAGEGTAKEEQDKAGERIGTAGIGVGSLEEEPSWWLRDGAIEELKGRMWLAGREGW